MAVPTLINFKEFEIGAALVNHLGNKFKTRAEWSNAAVSPRDVGKADKRGRVWLEETSHHAKNL
jgi:hypothetical protein